MDRRGGCCIAKYVNDSSKVERVMLKFRPIAPKPILAGDNLARSPAESNERVGSKTGRGKKGSNKKNNNNSSKKKRGSSEETKLTRNGDSVVTLPLLPETPERKEESQVKEESQSPKWLSFGRTDGGHVPPGMEQRAVIAPLPVRTAVSVITVECVTDTWLDASVLGSSDQERIVKLARDTCPGFISDGLSRVVWSNGAYSEMVGNGEGIVWLVINDKVPITCGGFSCRVRVQSTCRKEKRSMMLPCDVWRMDGGGFAWRLDVEAALCLGR